MFKGNLCLHVLYRNAEGGLGVWERQLPFSQFCDLTGDYEQAQMDAQVVVTSSEPSGSRVSAPPVVTCSYSVLTTVLPSFSVVVTVLSTRLPFVSIVVVT